MPYLDDIWGDATPWDARIGAVNPLLNFLPEEQALPLVPRYLSGIQPWLDTLDARIRRRPEGAFMGGRAPHHGEFASFHICDNIQTLGGPTWLSSMASPRVRTWLEAMRELPAVAAHMRCRPQAGTCDVGKAGSLIYRRADPAYLLTLINGSAT